MDLIEFSYYNQLKRSKQEAKLKSLKHKISKLKATRVGTAMLTTGGILGSFYLKKHPVVRATLGLVALSSGTIIQKSISSRIKLINDEMFYRNFKIEGINRERNVKIAEIIKTNPKYAIGLGFFL